MMNFEFIINILADFRRGSMTIQEGATEQSWDITKNEVNIQEIQKAKVRLAPHVPVTPVSRSLHNTDSIGNDVFFKLENFNISGSFKIRGAGNALLSSSETGAHGEVVAASAGNHAQGVAYMSRLLGRKAKIYMPERTPIVKIAATKSHGAEVILKGQVYDDAYAAALEYQSQSGATLVHAFADAAVINGQGTVGLELLDQISNLGVVVVPIGGGGLIGGVACALKSMRPEIKIIGVQTKSFPSMKSSMAAKKITGCTSGMTLADGIAVKRPSSRTLSLANHYIDDILLVSDDEIAAAIMSLMEKDHVLAEGAGAASVAALQVHSEHLKSIASGKPICCIVSGGNIDVPLVGRIANRGLIATGRMMRLTVRIPDRPGQLAEILNAIGRTGANLIDLRHNRHFGALYYSDVDVEIDLETMDFKHQSIIKSRLDEMKLHYTI
jgi:threonine dehydratase